MSAAITDTQGIVAIAAAAVAVIALIACGALAMTVRRLRRSQQLVIGERGERDVVAHAADMQDAFEALRSTSRTSRRAWTGGLAGAETALHGAIAHRALVRYDAYNELSGQQSMSIALLDDARSGIVLSCIHHRDQARVYAKQVHGGRGELELSPEEAEAVRLALSPVGSGERGGSPMSPSSARAERSAGDRAPARRVSRAPRVRSGRRRCWRAPSRAPWSRSR